MLYIYQEQGNARSRELRERSHLFAGLTARIGKNSGERGGEGEILTDSVGQPSNQINQNNQSDQINQNNQSDQPHSQSSHPNQANDQATHPDNNYQDYRYTRYADILADPEYMRDHRIFVREPSFADEVVLLFGGDILFDPGYAVMAAAIERGGTVEDAFCANLLEMMQSADIMMLNNEFTYTRRGEPTSGKRFTFRADPSSAAWLIDMGVDIVSLANNHTFDYGEVSLLDTIEALETHGINHVGAGRNMSEASAPVFFIVGDIKIAILAATQIERLANPDTREATATAPGVMRFMNPARLLEAVTAAKEVSDFVVVFVHWGTESADQPDWMQIDHAPLIAAAGADLIIGSHPHVLQGIVRHGNTPIAYSLGDFWFSSRTTDTGLLEVVINEDGIKTLRFIPAIQRNCFTSILLGSEKARVLDIVRNLSPRTRIDEEGYISW
ncbi:MAG: CapA family protein [Lachnospiraceae bacterium]|nr:CapA family protein [Lachnospiraceae bacterium]